VTVAAQQLEEATERAIEYKIGQEFSGLTDSIHRYISSQEAIVRNKALALHRGFDHLRTDLVPEMETRIISDCLDLGVRDAGLIANKMRSAFDIHLTGLAQSLGASCQTPATVGAVRQSVMLFEGWIAAYCGGVPARAHLALEKKKRMEQPPRSPEPAPHTVNLSVAMPPPQTAQAPSPAPPTKEHWGQFGIKQLVTVTGFIVAALAASYAVGRHSAQQPQPPSTALVPAPSTTFSDQKDKEIDSLKRDKADLATKLQQVQSDLAAERGNLLSRRPPERKRLKLGPSENVTATSASGPALAAGPGAHDISQTINQFGHPPRHLTDEDRQLIISFSIPKDAPVIIGAPMGDSEAAGYAEEIYSFMKAIGYTNFKINNLTGSAVGPSIRALPSPPMFSFQKDPTEGTYNILVHQQR
jgi:hypothetical protein